MAHGYVIKMSTLTICLLLQISAASLPQQVGQVWLFVGDSKTTSGSWQTILRDNIRTARPAIRPLWFIQTPRFRYGPGIFAKGGMTTAQLRGRVDADLEIMFGEGAGIHTSHIFYNMSINDAPGLESSDEIIWKANTEYIIDALHRKYPSALLWLTRVWGRNYDSECDLLATWIVDLHALKTFTRLGPDERIVIKAEDNGVTNTTDGLHYSIAGDAAWAAEFAILLGY